MQSRAQRIVSSDPGQRLCRHSIERKEKKRNPVAPFITSRLQQDAARKLHFSPKKTMTLAQQLYEGSRNRGGRSYRSHYLYENGFAANFQEAMAEARQVIQERFGAEYLPATPNVYKTRKRRKKRTKRSGRPQRRAIQSPSDSIWSRTNIICIS